MAPLYAPPTYPAFNTSLPISLCLQLIDGPHSQVVLYQPDSVYYPFPPALNIYGQSELIVKNQGYLLTNQSKVLLGASFIPSVGKFLVESGSLVEMLATQVTII